MREIVVEMDSCYVQGIVRRVKERHTTDNSCANIMSPIPHQYRPVTNFTSIRFNPLQTPSPQSPMMARVHPKPHTTVLPATVFLQFSIPCRTTSPFNSPLFVPPSSHSSSLVSGVPSLPMFLCAAGLPTARAQPSFDHPPPTASRA